MLHSFCLQTLTSANTCRMKQFILAFFLALAGFISLSGQSVILEGRAPQYANEFMLVEVLKNPITEQLEVLDTLHFGEDGSFRLEVALEEEKWLYIHSGIFHLRLFTQPGRGYKIILPPKTERTVSDFRNPFFQPFQAHIQVEKEFEISNPHTYQIDTDINSEIFRFDTLISNLNNRIFNAYARRMTIDSDSVIGSIECSFSGDSSQYFYNYRKFRYGLVKINSRDVGLKYIFENYLEADRLDLHNPAFLELFNEMYNEFLFYYSKTDAGKNVPFLINWEQDVNKLTDTLMKHDAVPDRQLAELILVRDIFNIYEKNYFPKKALLNILDSIQHKSEYPETIALTAGIRERLTKLELGTVPPSFSLPDADQTYFSLENFSGKYLYLIFCTPSNYGCMKEFPFLQVLHEAHKQHLTIVTIFVSEDIQEMQEFMHRNGYTWTALYFDKKEDLLEDYNVKHYPTGYLLDPEGKLVQSPASLATERFEIDLYRIMRSRGDL